VVIKLRNRNGVAVKIIRKFKDIQDVQLFLIVRKQYLGFKDKYVFLFMLVPYFILEEF